MIIIVYKKNHSQVLSVNYFENKMRINLHVIVQGIDVTDGVPRRILSKWHAE